MTRDLFKALGFTLIDWTKDNCFETWTLVIEVDGVAIAGIAINVTDKYFIEVECSDSTNEYITSVYPINKDSIFSSIVDSIQNLSSYVSKKYNVNMEYLETDLLEEYKKIEVELPVNIEGE